MKNPNSISKILLLSILMLGSIFSCKNGQQPVIAEKMPPSLASYIYAYTSGTISKVDDIRIRFVQPMVDMQNVNQNIPKSLLKFSPNIKGSLNWENERTLIFIPDDQMKSSTQYLSLIHI